MNLGPKHRTRFLCEVRIPGIAYVGAGNSTTKKDAEKNAGPISFPFNFNTFVAKMCVSCVLQLATLSTFSFALDNWMQSMCQRMLSKVAVRSRRASSMLVQHPFFKWVFNFPYRIAFATRTECRHVISARRRSRGYGPSISSVPKWQQR